MTEPRRVFVTGALGFIGRTVLERYRAAGAEVRGVDVLADPGLDVVAGDIAEAGDWQRHAAGADVVVHTAAMVSMRSGMDAFWRVNTLGTRRVLDAAIRGGASRIVHLSSVTVFGNDFPDQVTEDHPVRPGGVPYVDTKIAGEQVVLQAHAEGKISATIIRPGDVYGPGSKPWTLIPVHQLRRRQLILPAHGNGIFSPVYIDNLVDGLTAAASSAATAGQVLTISDGIGVTTSEFFDHYAGMLGRRRVPTAPTRIVSSLAGILERTGRLRGIDVETTPNAVHYLARTGTYAIGKATSLLGYRPAIDLAEGMDRTRAWLNSNGHLGQ
ncbi:NAD-dependent epimerase/dehydratase family protein [Amycolatopsis nigrescens]|uniref:NAD-dependent epimerase/dehydratase family protein n=1 Tax=Amycolatopsis nigrescens TaxID=381445 RepID=UPI000369A687|nr:NAD-dependent epimerase/dehydratase family protein [Amycolatopsis nigrescens]